MTKVALCHIYTSMTDKLILEPPCFCSSHYTSLVSKSFCTLLTKEQRKLQNSRHLRKKKKHFNTRFNNIHTLITCQLLWNQSPPDFSIPPRADHIVTTIQPHWLRLQRFSEWILVGWGDRYRCLAVWGGLIHVYKIYLQMLQRLLIITRCNVMFSERIRHVHKLSGSQAEQLWSLWLVLGENTSEGININLGSKEHFHSYVYL